MTLTQRRPTKELSRMLRRSAESVLLCERFPSACITIVLQVLKDDGAVLSAAINAMCLALLDAGTVRITILYCYRNVL